ncbi:phosphoadenosine phosphosulfate reductase family protein [Halorubellus salinus]|uniref:phosphoadenosine phosphosulfate reductase family protein n=1 Tax=Halorubellus salinus TaxID=755309 RepID=UPI001D0764DB|nr:phosphoadenosine phosphosulfate reductase family protein [Halorubellus salinus]
MSTFPEYVTVDYESGASETAADYPSLESKFGVAAETVRTALDQYRNPAVMFTGGKDSTVVAYVVREVALEGGFDLPPLVFLDHYRHFEETIAFAERWADEWGFELVVARNETFAGFEPGSEIAVADLPEHTQRELRDVLEYDADTFVFSPDTLAGNHLLKTVALNETITDRGFDGVFSGIRWDEQDARATETFFSPRHDAEKYPPHDRVHPILAFDERAVWDAIWRYVVPDSAPDYPEGHVPVDAEDLPEDVAVEDLPVHPLYFDGYRSLGTKEGSAASDDRAAWTQDVEGTTEREGRAQDKEDIMARLRDLGYM